MGGEAHDVLGPTARWAIYTISIEFISGTHREAWYDAVPIPLPVWCWRCQASRLAGPLEPETCWTTEAERRFRGEPLEGCCVNATL
jgi:hypothetical protein